MNPLLPIDPLHDGLPLGPMLETLAARRGDTPLWQRPHEEAPRTLGAVVAEARTLASWLAAAGLGPGDRVAVVTERYEPWALTALATALAGLTLVPLPSCATPAIQASLLARSSPRALLMSHEAWAALLPVFVQRRDPIPELLLVDEAVGPLPPGLHALEDILASPIEAAGTRPQPDEVRPHGADGAGAARPDGADGAGAARPDGAEPPAALFYNNGSCGRAEAAAIGPAELRAALDILRSAPEVGRSVDGGGVHGVLQCPMTASGYLFDLWRPLVLGARILDLSAVRRETAALRAAIGRHRPVALSLGREDIPAAFGDRSETARTASTGSSALALARDLLAPLGSRLARALRGGPTHGVSAAWFFREVPSAADLVGLEEAGVTAIRTYQVSECAALCGVAPEPVRPLIGGGLGLSADRLGGAPGDGTAPAGYRVPSGVSVRILAPGPDGVGEIAIGGPAVASEALDASRSLVPLVRVEGHLPTGDVGRLDAAGRLHVLGTQTFALRTPEGTLTAEQVTSRYDGGPWQALVAVPERLLWPEEVPESTRWVGIVHGAEAAATRRFIVARSVVVPGPLRIHGLVCSPAAFPLGTHGRLRREALLGALRSAFAGHASTAAERARIIDWLPSPLSAGVLP